MLGSWPLCEALLKSVANWLSCDAAEVLPSAVAVLAALCRLVAICAVTCWYWVGLDCCNCCNVLISCANGESWPLSGCDRDDALTLLEVVLVPRPVP